MGIQEFSPVSKTAAIRVLPTTLAGAVEVDQAAKEARPAGRSSPRCHEDAEPRERVVQRATREWRAHWRAAFTSTSFPLQMRVSAHGLRIRRSEGSTPPGAITSPHRRHRAVAFPVNRSERSGDHSAVMIIAWSMSPAGQVENAARPSSKAVSTRPGSLAPCPPDVAARPGVARCLARVDDTAGEPRALSFSVRLAGTPERPSQSMMSL